MSEPKALPIIVAVTGHRDLRAEDVPLLERTVRELFVELRTRYPASELLLLTPLAPGADRLVARIAIEQQVPFRVPLPLPEDEYRRDFDAAGDDDYDGLLARADRFYFLGYVGDNDAANVSEPARRARQYAAVGAHLARVSHVMIALWNGKPSDATGSTAQVVGFRLRGAPDPYRGPAGLLDAPETGPVHQIVTPRIADPETERPAGTVVVIVAPDDGALGEARRGELLRRIEQFNRDARELALTVEPRTATANVLPSSHFKLVAAALANRFQRRFHWSLRLVVGATALAGVALILGHTPFVAPAFVLAYTVLIVIAVVCYYLARRGLWQNKFIEYRALEIGLAVQESWDVAGVRESAADYYLRLQRSELDWIREAVRTVHHLEREPQFDPAAGVAAVRAFVADQLRFFRTTSRNNSLAYERFEIGEQIAFWGAAFPLTILLAALSVWQLATGHVEGRCPPGSLDLPCLGEWLINGIALATIVVAVLHEYPRRRAYHAQSRRYIIMAGLYARALQILEDVKSAPLAERLGKTQEVVREIGREALAENGDWLMIHRELPLELMQL